MCRRAWIDARSMNFDENDLFEVAAVFHSYFANIVLAVKTIDMRSHAMATFKTACYCGLGPGDTGKYLPILRTSGANILINWALHIGRTSLRPQQWGDFVFNSGYPQKSYPFISNGRFNPYNNPAIQAWPNDLASLKQGGSVGKIFFSIGGQGDPVFDFTTALYMLDNGMTDVLRKNFTALRNNFPAIDGIDLDCEEFGFTPSDYPDDYPIHDPNRVGTSTIFQLCQILFDLEFEVTFCPYESRDEWQQSMQLLSKAGRTVSWWNLQCYSGGNGNRREIGNWLKTIGAVRLPNGSPIGLNAGAYLVPGLAVQNQDPAWQPNNPQCPAGPGGMCDTFANMNLQGRSAGYNDLAGGFLWNFEAIVSNTLKCGNSIPSPKDYTTAIINGLNNNCS